MKSFKPNGLTPTTIFAENIKKLMQNNSLFSNPLDGIHPSATLIKAKPVLVFSTFWSHGEFLRESKCTSGGKYVPCTYLSGCYAYSEDGRWWKLMKPTSTKSKPTWSIIDTNHLPTKEYQVKAMLLKESF